MSDVRLSREIAAEFIGTALLLATVVGSGIMAETLSGGNIAIALLANTLATGAILIVLIWIFAPLSGAHFNPAVTLSFLLRKEISTPKSLAFVAAQVTGAIAGVWLAHLMFDVAVIQFSANVRTGPAQWLSEGVATFGLVLTILGTLPRGSKVVAVAVGLYISAAYWFTASTSFANPAVTIGRSFSDTFSGIRPDDALMFIGAQLVGAVAATLLARWLFVSQEN
jgi:glycerol uptake facilitator-like aquaporin